MPKLFFKRKKKKAKPSIKDALTPNSAFVAVPNTPPPENASNQKQKFTFSTRPEISAPIPVTTTSCRDGDLQQGYVGNYSLVGPADVGGEDSEPEPGYACIRRDSPVNQAATGTEYLKLSSQHNLKTLREGVPLPATPDGPSQREFNKSLTPPPSNKIHSTSELPSVTSGLSVHSDTSLNSSLNSGSPLQKQASKSTREKQLNEEEVAAMYSKVTKNRKVVGEKNDQSPSADLPPKAPRDSPATPRSRRGNDRIDGIREGSASPQKRVQSKTHSEAHNDSNTSRDSERRRKDRSSPKNTRHTPETADYYHSEEERVVEYSDEDYLPSCEDSISISENLFDEEGSFDNREDMHSPTSRFRSRSATLPPHHLPTSGKSSHKSQSAKKPRPLSRPASSPLFTSPQIPAVHPPFMQSVTMPQESLNGTYILSETQPDGSVQYFTATPVYSPSSHATPTRVFQPINPGTLPIAVNVPTVASVPMTVTQYAAGPNGLTESGYYSNIAQPLTSTPTSHVQQHIIPQLNTSVQSPPSTTRPDIPTTSPQTMNSRTHSASKTVTPAARTLSPNPKVVLQNGASPTLSHPTGGHTLPKSQTQNGHLEVREDKETASLQQTSAKLYSHMISQFKQNEASLRAQIKALETENSDLHRQNKILQQSHSTMKKDAGNSAEKLQAQVSSVIKDNIRFQEELRQKDQQISLCKDQIYQQKEEAANLLEENQMLISQQQLKELEQSEWETVAEHAHSVMEENASLLRQQELQREQMKELRAEHQAMITQLKGEISKQQKDRETVERKLISLRESHTQLQDQFDSLTQESAKQLTMEEHQQALEEIQELLDELAEKNETDAKSQETQMRVFQKEKKEFVTRLTDAKAIILQLEEDCTQMRKINRKTQKKIAELQYELEASRDREVVAHYQLTKAVAHAEKAMLERDTFVKIAKTQQKAFDRTAAQSERRSDGGSIAREGHSHLYKAQRKHYEGEIKHLRSLIAKKQDHLSGLRKT